ncbi:MAG TPA: GNAT family N-acetyltransferase [Candidatus Acidoferrales bacterium]|nr:GNAT family N-acetyltransferase [Candidatus Acidoferrales bacterium]
MSDPGIANDCAIRPARREDAPALAPLSDQLGYPATPAQIASRLGRILAAPAEIVLVAESGARLVGWVHAALTETVQSDRSAEVRGLVIDRELRGAGVGRALMGQVESWAREQRCAVVTLRSNIVRSGAHAFYRRLGYTIVKTQHAFRKNLL